MSLIKPRGKRTLDRILDPSYLTDLASLPLQELRRRREETEREEAWLSYIRRMLHGRIDILQERDLIASDGGLDIDALVASLSDQMGPGSHQSSMDVIESPGGGRREVERLVAKTGLDHPADLSEDEAKRQLDTLRGMEREVSQARSAVHEIQDRLTRELARRYRDGEAQPENVLRETL